MWVRRVLSLGAAAVLATAGALVVSSTAGALTFTPASTTDSATAGSNSLRDIIQNQATNAGGDEVDLAAGATYTLNVCSGAGSGQLTHGNTPLIISTPSGAPATIQQTCTNQRVLDQGTGGLVLNNVIITGGNPNLFGIGSGGGVRALGDVTVTNSTITGNHVPAGAGGGIEAFGAVTVTSSTISDNTVVCCSGGGGGILGLGAVTVTNSTISGNDAGSSDGGGISAEGNVTVTNSTITDNIAGTNSVNADGGGVLVHSPGSATVTNSTISSNTATDFGGGVATIGGTVTLVYATVVQNTAPSGANLVAGLSLTSSLTSFGSVVALAQGFGPPPNCLVSGATTSNGFNFSDDASCGFTAATDTQNGGDPKLGALADNGGPTQTRLPQSGSALIDVIPTASCQADGASGIITDQRGVSRPQGSACDIGAVEIQAAAPPGPTPAAPVAVTPKFTG